MLLFDREKDNVRYAVWHITETSEELAALIPNGDKILTQAKAQFKSETRIREWIGVRTLLYSMLNKYVHIEYLDNGAPYLVDNNNEISISHTKGFVCVILSEKQKVGIDIEQISNKVDRVSSRFIGENEPSDSIIKMHLIWSAKEAVYKLLQIEGLDFKNDLKVRDFNESENGTFILCHKEMEYTIDYNIESEYVMTMVHIPKFINKQP